MVIHVFPSNFLQNYFQVASDSTLEDARCWWGFEGKNWREAVRRDRWKAQTDAFEFTKRETLNNDKITTEFKTLMFGSPFETTQAKVQTTTIKANDAGWGRQTARADRKLNNRHTQCSLGSIRLLFGTSEACPYPFSAWIASEKRGYNAVKRWLNRSTFARRAFLKIVVFSSQVWHFSGHSQLVFFTLR